MKLAEYVPALVPRSELAEATAEYLWEHYRDQVRVEWPSPRTDKKWRLTPQGWVGYIPTGPETGIMLQPKVPISNLFRMLDYAYDLASFRFLEGSLETEAVDDLFERLAQALAERIHARTRQGIFRGYARQERELPYVRGRVNVARAVDRPWDVRFSCTYRQHTADLPDNQILLYTLHLLTRSGLRSARARDTVRSAYRGLPGEIALRPFQGRDCTDRVYTRLNQDYEQLHALSRFFLDSIGPSQQPGASDTLPFLINMNSLFESFVYHWLALHLPPHLTVRRQEVVPVERQQRDLAFRLDLVIYERDSGTPLCVLDTKYKDHVALDDVAQVIAYAEVRGVPEVALVYPTNPTSAFDITTPNHGIRVRTMTFPLDRNVEEAGASFIKDLSASLRAEDASPR